MHGAAHRPGQPRLPVQRPARLRQDHQSARILARCLNCAAGPDRRRRAASATRASSWPAAAPASLDVIEIDAASHGGVDDARDLRERAFFAPGARPLQDLHHRRGAHGDAAGLQRAAQDRRGAAGAREVHLRDHRAREGHRHHPLAHAPLPVPARAARAGCRTTWSSCASRRASRSSPGVLPLVVRAGGGSVRDSLSVLDQLIAGSGAEGVDLRARRRAARLHRRRAARRRRRRARGAATPPRCSARSTGSSRPGTTRAASSRTCSSGCATSSSSPRRARRRRRRCCAHVPEDQLERMRRRPPRSAPAALSRAADVVNAGAHRDDRRHRAAAAARAHRRAHPAARCRRRGGVRRAARPARAPPRRRRRADRGGPVRRASLLPLAAPARRCRACPPAAAPPAAAPHRRRVPAAGDPGRGRPPEPAATVGHR